MKAARVGMTRQVAIGASLASLVAVVAAGIPALSIVRTAYDAQTRQTLQRQAELIGAMETNRSGTATRPYGGPLQRLLAASGIVVLRVSAAGEVSRRRSTLPEGMPEPLSRSFTLAPEDVDRAAQGVPLSGVRNIEGKRFLATSQPLSNGGSVVLLQRSSEADTLAGDLIRQLAFAALIGLATAALVGVVVARRVTQPLITAARAARRLAAGERELRLDEQGPSEVAEVAASLNSLATALAASERRQREFLLSISHELRTPLTGISGFAEAVADRIATGDDAAAAGATIRAEAVRMQRLVADLLDLARLGADDFRLDLRIIDLTELLRDAAEVWSQRCEAEGVCHTVELPHESVYLQTDPGRLRQVVDGLAENALRVTPSGHPIVFALRVDLDAQNAVIEVRDGGPGLRPEDFAVAFEGAVLYERYRGVRRVGTGLGLALVRGLVTRLGGTAQAGPAAEGGACFSVALPLAALPEPLSP